ncbi:hypothetical protein [Methylobacterium radiotolerans]|uniref:hypothetical protein n=1 Tax=Methylobacterium radiotolerans TaxID=31998 RepID=UPI000976D751|nr:MULTISPECIES: hypothetical protein [Methylobacterium]MDE3747558.1 hypothetical protein [Methylobacterium radiotolerans]ONF48404.1 hypothetical protein RSM1_14730 [Methylobacterium radiotolerans]PVY96500.1 hypothetical protein C7388_119125 [Methylobacterium organophilum]
MAKEPPTVSELFKAKAVTDDEVNAAVDAALADLATEAYPLSAGYALDLNAAIQASRFATLVLKDDHATQRQKQHAARTAILLAHPVKR